VKFGILNEMTLSKVASYFAEIKRFSNLCILKKVFGQFGIFYEMINKVIQKYHQTILKSGPTIPCFQIRLTPQYAESADPNSGCIHRNVTSRPIYFQTPHKPSSSQRVASAIETFLK